MLDFKSLKPLQCMVASLFFRKKRMIVVLPRQEGKTELGVRILHDITKRPFTSSSLFLAKDKKAGKKATREKFTRLFDKNEFMVNTENVYLKKHPTSIIFMDSVDKEPDRIRGGTYSMIHWSEVAFSKIQQGETIITVFDKIVQPTLRKTSGYVLLETTLNGKNDFHTLYENASDYGLSTFKVGLSDLVWWGLVSEAEYNEIQDTTHPDVFRQEYECEFVSFAGKIFPEFQDRVHIRECHPPQAWQKVVASIDWGWSPSATCVLFGYVEEGVLYVFHEHYAMEEMPAITADQINAVKHTYDIKTLATVADHDLARNEELNRRSIECSQADKVNVMGALVEVKEKLYFHRLMIHPRCKQLIKELQNAVWDKDGKDVDYKVGGFGHWDSIAALRYLVRAFGDYEVSKPTENPHTDSASQAAFDLLRARRDNN